MILRHLDLFSGIGGFALAARMAGGYDTVAFCELDRYCRKVLGWNFPGVPVHPDIKTFDPKPYEGNIDIITGGYPCQPFSVAGRRAGGKDPRHLWPYMLRIVRDIRPPWVLCENVVGHITLGLDEVLTALATEGYSAMPFVIPACAVDSPQRRDRVWVVAHSTSLVMENIPDSPMAEGPREAQVGSSDDRCHLCGGEGWPPEPGVDRMAYGIPHRVDRTKGLGNAIVPQVAARILRAIYTTTLHSTTICKRKYNQLKSSGQ